jgi:mono/diheme cytochrome c family protein
MNRRTFSIISIFLLVLLLAILLAACGSNSQTATSAPSSGGSTGQALMQERCSACHSVNRVTSAQKTADQWKQTVDRMIARGAQLSSQEEQTLVDYLAQTYK